MRPLAHAEIRGNWATLMLPIEPDEGIGFSRLSDEIDRLIDFKVDGIYSNGTAGEFFTQTEEEFLLVNALLAEKCERAEMPFQVGAGHMSPQLALRRVEAARDLAPSAIQVILPDWFPVTDGEAVRFLNRAAELAGGVGLVLYNPPHAKRRLGSADFLHLLDRVPSLVGMKVADGGDEWYREMRPVFARASVFVPGHHLASGVRRGAHGAYSNVACLSPLHAQRWWDLMRTDLPAALEIEREVRGFWENFLDPYISVRRHPNFAVDKFAAAVGNWADIGTRVRFPYASIDEKEADALRERLPALLPGFLYQGKILTPPKDRGIFDAGRGAGARRSSATLSGERQSEV